MPKKANRQATSITAPSVDMLCKTALVARTDTTAFDAFALPKGVVVAGVYVIGQTASDAATSAVIDIGTNPATTNEILSGFDAKGSGKGYFPAGAAAGSDVGVQLTSDKLYKALYTPTGAEAAGGPWLVKVEYYFPQQGDPY